MEWWYGVLMADFSYDLIESSQYMQNARGLRSKFGSVCGCFFFLSGKSSKFSAKDRERERAFFAAGGEREPERERRRGGEEERRRPSSRSPLQTAPVFH